MAMANQDRRIVERGDNARIPEAIGVGAKDLAQPADKPGPRQNSPVWLAKA